MEKVILDNLNVLLKERGKSPLSTIPPEKPILGIGLDSLAFAVLVVRLETDLGIDPFLDSDDVVYPKTYGEFVAIYSKKIRA